MHQLTNLIKEDMKPALGVTEPGAIAFAVASAREHTEGEVDKVQVLLNSGMFKNAYTCGIPNSSHFGNLYAAALGAVAADAGLGLESLAGITPEDNQKAEQMVSSHKIEVLLDHIGSEITIEATVRTSQDTCTVRISGSHTDIREIEKNGACIFRKEIKSEKGIDGAQEQSPLIHQYSLLELLDYSRTVSVEELFFICKAYDMNLALLNEGLCSERTTIGPMLLEQNQGLQISKDALKSAQLLCNGAIEARVLGLNSPAMSITGSGAHGIIAVMPLYAYAQSKGLEQEPLLRASALSYLITMFIKEYSGRLSAFCGCGIAAGTGMACGLMHLRNAAEGRESTLEQMTLVIQNMAAGLTGMICDGGNQGCAMKGIVAVDAAFRAVDMAAGNVYIEHIHGIGGRTAEETMRHMGLIASPGMEKTEEVIVDIMKNKFK